MASRSNNFIKEEYEKRKQAEKQAHAIVEELLNDEIDKDFFMHSLKQITNKHYEDIVEERSIANMCGYCLCENKLSEVPKQQYKISRNKLYDIMERKKFCSNGCFAISKYLMKQISTTPLWLRNVTLMPDLTLPDFDEKTTHIKGDEIKLRHVVSEQEIESAPEENGDSERLNASVGENDVSPEQSTVYCPSTAQLQSKEVLNKNSDVPVTNKIHKPYQPVPELVLDIMKQWLTKSTLVYLGLCPEAQEDDAGSTKNLEENTEILQKEQRLQKQLDNLILGAKAPTDTVSKPLPDYQTLKKDTDIFEERVESFYKGSLNVKEKQHKKISKVENTTEEGDRTQSLLPTVDSKHQTKIRQKIVLDHILKLIDDLTPPLPNTFQECRKLVQTFRFTNKNVMLGSETWPLISLAVLCVLSSKNQQLKQTLESRVIIDLFELLLQPHNITFHRFHANVMTILNTL